MLQAIQQQFERKNVVFNEIWDRMDRQDAAIANWCEGHPQTVPNVRVQERRSHVDDFDDDLTDEFKDEDDQGEKGMVEVSEEIQDGKTGLTETEETSK
jgi:Mg2+ and Co2+ transporter CorA